MTLYIDSIIRKLEFNSVFLNKEKLIFRLYIEINKQAYEKIVKHYKKMKLILSFFVKNYLNY